MYTLRFPFTLPPGREIAVTDCFREVDGLSYRFAKQDRVYVLTLSGFPTAGAAEAHLRDIRAGFIWMLLQTGIAANAVFDPQKVTYAGDPMLAAANLSRSFNMQIDGPIDALLDGQRPAVYPSEKRIKVLTGGLASVIVSTPVEIVLKHLMEGLQIENSTRVVDDQKLLTAFDLYAAYFTEASPNARFLTLIMALAR
jgi:O-acetylhomoserine/O-acetylserine sulfhydrylase-like pyridoxal-dependent enzyme